MAKKKPSKFGAVKHDPLLMGKRGLDFENLKSPEQIELTDDQKATKFLSEYMEIEDPIGRYRDFFDTSAKGIDWELLELKRQFLRLVVPGKWTEEKFVQVANSIYRDNQLMSPVVLDARGRMFDNGALKKPEPRGGGRRRGRI